VQVEVHDIAVLLGAAPQFAEAVHPRVRALHHPAFPGLDRGGYALAGVSAVKPDSSSAVRVFALS
jgi:hypothetical protein